MFRYQFFRARPPFMKSVYKLMQLDSDDRQLLAKTYQSMYPDKHTLPSMVREVCRKYSSVLLAGEKIGSRLECRSLLSARMMALWADQDGQVSSRTAFRPGIVLFFFANTIKFRGGQYQMHVFACVRWYKEDSQREPYRRPVEIWKLRSFSPAGPATFLPVQRCYCKFATAQVEVSGVEKLSCLAPKMKRLS